MWPHATSWREGPGPIFPGPFSLMDSKQSIFFPRNCRNVPEIPITCHPKVTAQTLPRRGARSLRGHTQPVSSAESFLHVCCMPRAMRLPPTPAVTSRSLRNPTISLLSESQQRARGERGSRPQVGVIVTQETRDYNLLSPLPAPTHSNHR